MKVQDRILVITDILLGMLYADATFSGSENRAVRALLADLLLTTPAHLPPHVDRRIREFDPRRFDLRAAALDFAADPPMKKRRLLELVAKMSAVDGVLDLSEDDYIHQLAGHLGMAPHEYADLVLDYESEDLRDTFADLLIPTPGK